MPTKKTTKKPSQALKLSYEECVEELEGIVEKIESGEIGLQESLAQRKRGDELIKRCRTILDEAEQELRQINAEGESTDE
ncbi:MAG: exodeoxyribonuclease VII small subunit [Planctomycetota bacterium]|nr:exodeoxyribonuclease VII small subunit [Planctomycetota bacterium]